MADAGSCTPAKLQRRHSASFCSCSVWPCIPRNQPGRPLAAISLWDFLTLISVSDFDILACTVIQIGWALEKYLDLDDSNGP